MNVFAKETFHFSHNIIAIRIIEMQFAAFNTAEAWENNYYGHLLLVKKEYEQLRIFT